LDLDEFLKKLEKVLMTRKDLLVVARTDANDFDEIIKRVKAFDEVGADWILVDGISNLDMIRVVKSHTKKPLVFNHIAGGKSPSLSLTELKSQGISAVLYSTPCLFAAQAAIQKSIESLKAGDGLLSAENPKSVDLASCQALLEENLRNRDGLCERDHE